MRRATIVLIMVSGLIGSLQAGVVPLNLTGVGNTTFATDSSLLNGNLFPTGTQTYNGVQFNLGSVWAADIAAGGGSGLASVTIPVGLSGVTQVDTLINTEWGVPGLPSYLSVTFVFSNGSTYIVNLLGNTQVRDYNNYTWTNQILTPWNDGNGQLDTTTMAWNDISGAGCGTCSATAYQRLDEQVFNLPASTLSLTLTSIIVNDAGNHSNPGDATLPNPTTDPTHPQRSIVAGVTINQGQQATPEPGTWALLASGAGALLIFRKRQTSR